MRCQVLLHSLTGAAPVFATDSQASCLEDMVPGLGSVSQVVRLASYKRSWSFARMPGAGAARVGWPDIGTPIPTPVDTASVVKAVTTPRVVN